MTQEAANSPLVAIGGLGGSGTRVLAAAVQAAGIDIGQRLNGPLDNLWFTVLFKRAAWCRQRPPAQDIAQAVALFTRAMTTGLRGKLSADERALLMRLHADLPPNGRWRCGASAADVESLIDSTPPLSGTGHSWGWKEPNTHIFMPQIAQQFPHMRYIHVVRNGLDMAFSKNTWQARHWGSFYGLTYRWYRSAPQQQLRFWVAANRAMLNFGAEDMPGRFLVVPYEDFCAQPDWHWPRLRDFLGLSTDTVLSEDMLRPTTIGRSQDHDFSKFSSDLLSAANDLQSELKTFHAPT